MNKQISKENIQKFIDTIKPLYPNLKFLIQMEVIQWCMEDLSFLGIEEEMQKIKQGKKQGKTTKKELSNVQKKLEDIWGRKITKKRKNWTTSLSETLCEEIYTVMNEEIKRPKKPRKHLKKPDREIKDAIIEVKSGTYFTEGTAYDKIYSVPLLYVPDLPEWNKKLIILVVAKAEKYCLEQGLLGENMVPSRKKYLDLFKQDKCEFVGFSDLLSEQIQKYM